MQLNNLGIIERKVLGSLLILENGNNESIAKNKDIADSMGYKQSGGDITFALKILERDNYIVRIAKNKYKILV